MGQVIAVAASPGSRPDVQRGNLPVPEGKPVAKLDGTAGERAADLGHRNRPAIHRLHTRDLRLERAELRDGIVQPRPDRLAPIFVVFVGNHGVGRKQVEKVLRAARVVRLEKAIDRCRQFRFHRFVSTVLFVIPNRTAPGRTCQSPRPAAVLL